MPMKSSTREVALVGLPPLPAVPVTANRAERRGTPRIIRRHEVKYLTGLAHSTIYVLMKEGLFPKVIRIPGTNSVGWVYDEILDWIEATIASRDEAKPAAVAKPAAKKATQRVAPVEAKPAKRAAVVVEQAAPKPKGRPKGTTKEAMAKRKARDEAREAG